MMNLFRNIRLVLVQYREYQAALSELGVYSDRELAEIGIARGDVPRLAYLEAERRVAGLAPAGHVSDAARATGEGLAGVRA